MLAPENRELLNQLELEACEEALVKAIKLLNDTRSLMKTVPASD